MNNLFKILILILCVSCNKNEKKLPKHYKKFDFPEALLNNINKFPIGEIKRSKFHKIIDVSNKEQVILKGSKVIDSCWYVPLETKKESLIGHISKMLIMDDKIFILDSRTINDLFIFNLKGKFISRLGKKGKGPGEYGRISDFSIDSENKYLIIHDDRMANLFYYDFDGNHIKNKKTSFRFFNFQHFNNTLYYFLGGSDNKHSPELESHEIAIETKNKLQNLYIPRVKTNLIYGLEQQFHYSGEHLSFAIPVTGNNIYNITNDKIDIAYTINFGEKSINESIIKKLPEYSNYIKASEALDFSFFMGKHFETKTKLYFSYLEGKTNIDVLYNKNTENLIVSKEIVSDDPYSLLNLGHNYAIYEEDVFISACEPILFVTINKFKERYKFKSNTLKKLTENIKETDNPILVFHKYKEF